jgi:hypothetical protein
VQEFSLAALKRKTAKMEVLRRFTFRYAHTLCCVFMPIPVVDTASVHSRASCFAASLSLSPPRLHDCRVDQSEKYSAPEQPAKSCRDTDTAFLMLQSFHDDSPVLKSE